MTEVAQAGPRQRSGRLSPPAPRGELRRVAIVGVGPHGLAILERLLTGAATSPQRPLTIDLFEPHRTPGAGSVYDPAQPACLRTNQAAGQIALSSFPTGHADHHGPAPLGRSAADDVRPSIVPRLSLLQWAAERGYRVGPEDYVPRALVGRYLHDAFCRLCHAAPNHVTLNLVPHRVAGVRRDGQRWVVDHQRSAAAARPLGRLPIRSGPAQTHYDRVFMAVADPPWTADPQTRRWQQAAERWGHRVVPYGDPAAGEGSLAEVPQRRSVAVRGFGLAAIDAILMLTEGRGGSFVAVGGPWRHARRYIRGWREPSRIFAFSRTGIPPSPQPLAAVQSGQLEGHSQQVAAVWQQAIDALHPPQRGGSISLWRDLLPVLVDCTVARWQLCRPGRRSGLRHSQSIDQVTTHLYGVAAGRVTRPHAPVLPHAVIHARRHETRVACGEKPLTLRAASAQAWRQLYPHWEPIVQSGRLPADERTAWRRLVAHFEPLAFGPSIDNVCRMLALIDAGVVDLTFHRSPAVTVNQQGFHLRGAQGSTTCRTLIDASRATVATREAREPSGLIG